MNYPSKGEIITTDRLILRPLHAGDAEAMALYQDNLASNEILKKLGFEFCAVEQCRSLAQEKSAPSNQYRLTAARLAII